MNKFDRKFKLITVSKDLGVHFPEDVKRVRLFNFTEGKIDLNISSTTSKNIIGTIDNCWIRVYDQGNKYYDFISAEVYFDSNDRGINILASEDTEFISVEKIGSMISSYIDDLEVKRMTNTQYVEKYTSLMLREIKIAGKELQTLQSLSSSSNTSRLDIEDSYEYGRNLLIKKYLLNLIASKIIKENKEAVLEFMAN